MVTTLKTMGLLEAVSLTAFHISSNDKATLCPYQDYFTPSVTFLQIYFKIT